MPGVPGIVGGISDESLLRCFHTIWCRQRRARRSIRAYCLFADAERALFVLCPVARANASPSNRKINLREKEKQILDKILGPAHYDRRIRPSAVNGTGDVTPFFLTRPGDRLPCLRQSRTFSCSTSVDGFITARAESIVLVLTVSVTFADGPTVVQINLMFRGFSAISDNKMVSMFFPHIFGIRTGCPIGSTVVILQKKKTDFKVELFKASFLRSKLFVALDQHSKMTMDEANRRLAVHWRYHQSEASTNSPLVILQEISTIVTFREEWYDDRLRFDDMQGNALRNAVPQLFAVCRV